MASSTDASAADDVVTVELLPFIRVYASGRVERLLGTDTVAVSLDESTGVNSKDVTIDPATSLSVRLYLLSEVAAGERLPILVYFHGGGFMVESAASPTYHRYLNALASRARVIAVSVEYRLAPEHPLPAAYDDSWAALAWAVAAAATPGGGDVPEPWLGAHGDASRVFLAGDSAGANIVHNVAMRAAAAPLPGGAGITGVMLMHPYFWDASNTMGPALEDRIRREWRFMCGIPEARFDDPRLSPTVRGAPSLAALPCKRVMVAVAGADFLAAKGRAYHAALLESRWPGEAELVDTPGEDHVFHLLQPGTAAAAKMMDLVVAFVTRT